MKRARLVVALVLGSLLATACGNDEGPTAPSSLPQLTSGATPTAPEVEPPPPVVRPVDADAPTSEGAASFATYYMAVINQAVLTNDPQPLRALSDPQCEGCNNYINSIMQTAATGATVAAGGITVTSAVAPPVQEGETTVLLNFDTTEYVSRAADGSEVARNPPSRGLVAEMRCVRAGSTWIVMGLRSATGAGPS